MQTDKAVQHIESIDLARAAEYEKYFATMKPETQDEVFRRWLFAYASVHTTWKANVALYNHIKDLGWLGDEAALRDRIIASRAGLHNNRARFINAFSLFFYDHPGWFMKSPWENWFEHRDRLMDHVPGLGIAKTSFALELVYFHDAGTVCFDTHQLQLYGMTPKEIGVKGYNLKQVKAMEQHWVTTCRVHGVNPVTARWLYFDQRQKQLTPTYWSYTLESNETPKFCWQNDRQVDSNKTCTAA